MHLVYMVPIYGIFCVNAVQLYTSWNTAIRILFGLPRKTQRHFIATNSDFIIPISLQPNVVDLKYFQTLNSGRSNNLSLKYKRFTQSED